MERRHPTTGRSYPPRKGSKRRKKDADNQWQNALTGHGPERTVKG